MYKECLHCKKFFEKPYSCSVRNFTDSTQRNFRKCCSRKCQAEYRKGNSEYREKLNLKGLEIGRKWWIGKIRDTTWNKGLKGIHLSLNSEFQKGLKPWNTGKKGYHITISEEGREKKRLARKGKKHSLEARKKISESQRGEKGNNWKGGVTALRLQIRKCFKSRQWTSDNLTRDDYTCQFCGKRGGRLHVDHYPKSFSQIFYENKITSLEQALECEEFWNINNGRTLCVPCHGTTDTYGINQRYIKEQKICQI